MPIRCPKPPAPFPSEEYPPVRGTKSYSPVGSVHMARELLPGNVIAKEVASRGETRRYRVEGRTARGKLRLRNLQTGGVQTTWWSRVRDLPKGYYLEDPLGLGNSSSEEDRRVARL